MKKLFTILLGFIFAASLIGPAMAQEKVKKEEPAPALKPAPEKPAEAAKAKEPQEKAKETAKKMAAPKPMIWRAGGVVNSFDPKTRTLAVRQVNLHHDRVLKLKVEEKAMKGISELKPGDLVNIWITDQMITALNKIS
jgi:Cu/Ag efflux protein CusF